MRPRDRSPVKTMSPRQPSGKDHWNQWSPYTDFAAVGTNYWFIWPFVIFECCSMPHACNSNISRGLPCGRISYRVKSCYLRALLRESRGHAALNNMCFELSSLQAFEALWSRFFSWWMHYMILCSSYCMFLFSTVFRCWYIHFICGLINVAYVLNIIQTLIMLRWWINSLCSTLCGKHLCGFIYLHFCI